jgi:hypothetical protein
MHRITLGSVFVAAAIGIAGCNQPEAPPPPSPRIIFIAPTSATAGSNDLTLMIFGHGFENTQHIRSTAVWTMGATTIRLTTTSVSDTQVAAVVPSALLTAPGTARVHVETGDDQADGPGEKSGEAIFAIVGAGPDTISITPSHAFAGSPDLTLTIRGSRFNGSRFEGSRALWTAYHHSTRLVTTFVSRSELTAIVPASLLTRIGIATVSVVSEDPEFDPPRAVPATFLVTSRPDARVLGVRGAGHPRLLTAEVPRTLGASALRFPSSSSRPSRRTRVIP